MDSSNPRSRLATPAVTALAVALAGAWTPVARAQEAVISAPGAALATGSDALETTIVAEMFEAAGEAGTPARFVPARRLAAGDEVHYTIRVRNPGREAVRDVQVTKRMPGGLHYVPGSAAGPASDVEFSADGGTRFAARPESTDFSHVRWKLRRPLPPGATAILRFRATFR